MAITIIRVGIKHKMSFSNPGSGERGFSVAVKTIDEIHATIDHYFMRVHDSRLCGLCREESFHCEKSRPVKEVAP